MHHAWLLEYSAGGREIAAIFVVPAASAFVLQSLFVVKQVHVVDGTGTALLGSIRMDGLTEIMVQGQKHHV